MGKSTAHGTYNIVYVVSLCARHRGILMGRVWARTDTENVIFFPPLISISICFELFYTPRAEHGGNLHAPNCVVNAKLYVDNDQQGNECVEYSILLHIHNWCPFETTTQKSIWNDHPDLWKCSNGKWKSWAMMTWRIVLTVSSDGKTFIFQLPKILFCGLI